MCHSFNANIAREMTNETLSKDISKSMSSIMYLIKEAIAQGNDHISVSYDTFNNIEQKLRDIDYIVTITADREWMNIRW